MQPFKPQIGCCIRRRRRVRPQVPIIELLPLPLRTVSAVRDPLVLRLHANVVIHPGHESGHCVLGALIATLWERHNLRELQMGGIAEEWQPPGLTGARNASF